MRKLSIIILFAALFLAAPLLAQEQLKLTEKQKQVQQQFDAEYQKLQKETEQLIAPHIVKKYYADEAIRDIQKDADKKFIVLKNQYDKKFIEAGKIEEKKDDTIKH